MTEISAELRPELCRYLVSVQDLGQTQEQLSAAPRTNVGAIPAPDSPGFLDRALKDPEFYAANRDKVMQAWKTRNRRTS